MMRPRPAVEVRRAALAVALLPRLVLPGPEVVELVDAADARDQRRALGPSRRANGAVVAQAAIVLLVSYRLVGERLGIGDARCLPPRGSAH